MNRKYILIIVMLFTALSSAAQVEYRSPVDYAIYLAGNVGEIRSGHFHSGIDIKASKGIGSPIYAAADGYISRIGVSPTGYGNVLYITHPNYETTVYGHLNNFNKEIEKWVRAQQNSRKSYKIDLYPDKNKFPVKMGDVIAYLGNSGSSGGPHLHFEVRNRSGNPRNVVRDGLFKIKDNVPPNLFSVTLYECDTVRGIVRYSATSKVTAKKDKEGKYTFDAPLEAHNPFYLAYEVIDHKNEVNNTFGIYGISQKVDSVQNFSFTIPWVSFTTSKFVQSFVQYDQNKKSRHHVIRAYVSANNNLSVYDGVVNSGIIVPAKNGTRTITTTIEDDSNNRITAQFEVKTIEKSKIKPLDGNYYAVNWDKDFTYSDSIMKATVPSRALYDSELMLFNSAKNKYTFGSSSTPLQKTAKLSVKPTTTDKELLYRAVFVNAQTKSVSKATYTDGWLSANIYSLGNYSVKYDTIAPKVEYRGIKGNRIVFSVSDEFSGVERYQMRIDGNWVLGEWDPKGRQIYHTLHSSKTSTTKTVELSVDDYCSNNTTKKEEFKW